MYKICIYCLVKARLGVLSVVVSLSRIWLLWCFLAF